MNGGDEQKIEGDESKNEENERKGHRAHKQGTESAVLMSDRQYSVEWFKDFRKHPHQFDKSIASEERTMKRENITSFDEPRLNPPLHILMLLESSKFEKRWPKLLCGKWDWSVGWDWVGRGVKGRIIQIRKIKLLRNADCARLMGHMPVVDHKEADNQGLKIIAGI